MLGVCCELFCGTDFSEYSNVFFELRRTENSDSAVGSILQNFGRCFNRPDNTASTASFNIYKKVGCVKILTQLTFLEEILLICVYLGRASGACPS